MATATADDIFSRGSKCRVVAFKWAREGSELESKCCIQDQIIEDGAHARIRTGDLFLTKEMLYRLSYVGGRGRFKILSAHRRTP